MTIATPSRAIPSRALVERARPSRAERREPAYIWRFGSDLIDRVSHVEATFGRIGPAWGERNGQLIQSPEDVPSYDEHGIRIRGEARTYAYETDHPGGYTSSNGTNDVAAFLGVDSGEAGLVVVDPDKLWHARCLVQDLTLSLGEPWTFSIYFKAGTPGDVGKAIRILVQEGPQTVGSVISDNIILTEKWTRHDVTLQVTDATNTTLALVVARGDDSSGDIMADNVGHCCWMLNPGTEPEDFIHNTGVNGSTATRTSEAADGSGNGLSIPMPDDMKAQMGELVYRTVDDQIIVETPVGDELIDDVAAWSMGTGWSDDGVNAVSAASVDAYINARKSLLTVGKRYIVTANVVVESGSIRFQGGTAAGSDEIITSGPVCVEIETNDTAFKVIAQASGFTGQVTNISVKEVQPEFTLVLGFIPDYAYDELDSSKVLLTGKTSSVPSNALIFLSGANPGRAASHNGTDYAYSKPLSWSAGDLVIAILRCKNNAFNIDLGEGCLTAPEAAGKVDISAGALLAKFNNEMDDSFVFLEFHSRYISDAEKEAYYA